MLVCLRVPIRSLWKMVSIGEALDFPPLTVRMSAGGITMLAIILLSFASPAAIADGPIGLGSPLPTVEAVPATSTFIKREIPKGSKLSDMTVDDLLTHSPNELAKAASGSVSRTPLSDKLDKREAHVMAITGGKGITASGPVDLTPNIDAELAAQAASIAKASMQEAAQRNEARSMPIPYLVGGGLLILIIGYGAGVRRRKALPASS